MESWRIKLKGQNLGALAASSTGRVTASLGAARMCASRDLSQVHVTRSVLQIQPFRWSKSNFLGLEMELFFACGASHKSRIIG